MSRTVNALKVLKILEEDNHHGFFTPANEIYERIGIDRRSISLCIKDLKEAGFLIDSVQGKSGGYRLIGMTFGPKEIYVISEALRFLEENNFKELNSFKRALDIINNKFRTDIK